MLTLPKRTVKSNMAMSRYNGEDKIVRDGMEGLCTLYALSLLVSITSCTWMAMYEDRE